MDEDGVDFDDLSEGEREEAYEVFRFVMHVRSGIRRFRWEDWPSPDPAWRHANRTRPLMRIFRPREVPQRVGARQLRVGPDRDHGPHERGPRGGGGR
ncbi:MAG: hypothetical protein QOJ29_3679 [Thermoleophilaceae bacterium]|jgi:hypothetical protein|nr:hypothetical protein [Thermoleophilaceae bacterium]